jgi:hypothetical protein
MEANAGSIETALSKAAKKNSSVPMTQTLLLSN